MLDPPAPQRARYERRDALWQQVVYSLKTVPNLGYVAPAWGVFPGRAALVEGACCVGVEDRPLERAGARVEDQHSRRHARRLLVRPLLLGGHQLPAGVVPRRASRGILRGNSHEHVSVQPQQTSPDRPLGRRHAAGTAARRSDLHRPGRVRPLPARTSRVSTELRGRGMVLCRGAERAGGDSSSCAARGCARSPCWTRSAHSTRTTARAPPTLAPSRSRLLPVTGVSLHEVDTQTGGPDQGRPHDPLSARRLSRSRRRLVLDWERRVGRAGRSCPVPTGCRGSAGRRSPAR